MTGPAQLLRGLVLSSVTVPLLALAAAAGDGSSADNPSSYAVRIPLTLAAGAPLQRLPLPAEALVRMQAQGYGDVRIFNAQGQAVPMALASADVPGRSAQQQVLLPAYPILGASTALASAGLDGLSLRIEERQGQRVVQINTAPGSGSTAGDPAGNSTSKPPAAQRVLGALLDARAVTAPAASMALDVDLPAGQPVTFSVQSSKDLKTWRPLASTVLYRAAEPGGSASPAGELGNKTLDLALADLADQYLRVTWGNADVTLRGATLATSRAGMRQRVSIPMARLALANPHELVFTLPFATPLAALKITPQASNVLVPVRVLGRNDREQPWAVLASAVVYRLAPAADGQPGDQVNGPVELRSGPMREIRIEADKKTAGFAAAPDIALQFEPAQIIFLASGQEPFTLAVGLAAGLKLSSPYLPLASLIPGYQPMQENTLAAAQADVARMDGALAAPGPLLAAQPANDGLPTRSLLLWGILLAGTLALAVMAWALHKQTGRSPGQVP
jgi:hypothetical protein